MKPRPNRGQASAPNDYRYDAVNPNLTCPHKCAESDHVWVDAGFFGHVHDVPATVELSSTGLAEARAGPLVEDPGAQFRCTGGSSSGIVPAIHECLVIVWKWRCSTHTRSELCGGMH